MTNLETNEQPDVVSFYKSTHHSLEKGWISPHAEENYKNMMEMLNQPIEEGEDPLTPDEVRKSVLDVRSGHGCSLGYGYVVPTQRIVVAATSATVAATIAVFREEMEQLRKSAKTAENQVCYQRRMLEQIMSRLGGDFT